MINIVGHSIKYFSVVNHHLQTATELFLKVG